MTSKILLPHDGTEISDKALEKSKEFAKALNAELYIFHVIEHSPLPPSLILDHDRQWIEESRRDIAKKLKEGWIKMAKEKINPVLEKENIKFKITASTDEPPISEQILKFASENKIDLIIMGSQRLSEISKIKALGSVSRKVSENVDCPIMIIH
ncbi:MAG TPA: universal stress protein [Nitrososphaeraceae archaeon]|nr:universal stress protein [Nitrososphaeraceae archaeon]HSL14265.1 universal stress protein [Nitrososphaeraceae archaeon]